MRRALNPVSFFIPAALTALLFATAWMTTPVFFQHLIAAKQRGIDQVVLIIAGFFVISFSIFLQQSCFYFFYQLITHKTVTSPITPNFSSGKAKWLP